MDHSGQVVSARRRKRNVRSIVVFASAFEIADSTLQAVLKSPCGDIMGQSRIVQWKAAVQAVFLYQTNGIAMILDAASTTSHGPMAERNYSQSDVVVVVCHSSDPYTLFISGLDG